MAENKMNIPSLMVINRTNNIAQIKNPFEAKIDHKVEYYKLSHLLQEVLLGKYNKSTIQADAEYIQGLQIEYEKKYGKPESAEDYYKTPEGQKEKQAEEYLKRQEKQKAQFEKYAKMYDEAVEDGSHTSWNLMYSTSKEEKEETIKLIKKQKPETMFGFMHKILENSGKTSSILTQISEENNCKVNEKWTEKEKNEVFEKILSNIVNWGKIMGLEKDRDLKELEQLYNDFKITKAINIKRADFLILSLMKRDFASTEYNGIKYIYVPKMTAPGLAPSNPQKIKMIGNKTFTFGLY